MTSSVEDAMEAFLKKKEEYDTQAEKGPFGYVEQFAELRQKTLQFRDEEKYSCSVGEKPYNIRKNRYKDIIPYDYSRVKLSMFNEMPGTDYINANYIKGPIHPKQYIAAQGPLPNTVKDFWRMLWEQKTKVVVMACAEYEGVPPKHRCERYWPTSTDDTLTFDQISVSLENEIQMEFADYVIREIRVECCRKVHKVYQLHYVGWPDHGVPDDVSPILDMVAKSHQYQTEESIPLVVHCSAGCGRTGTLIAIDYAYSMLKNGKLNMEFDLFDIIDDIRKQRPSMVQSVDQYRFAYSAVAELFLRHLSMMRQHPYENVQLKPKDKQPVNKPRKPAPAPQPGQSESSSNLPKVQKPPVPRQKPTLRAVKPQIEAKPQNKNTDLPIKPASLPGKRSSCVPSTPFQEVRSRFVGNKPPEIIESGASSTVRHQSSDEQNQDKKMQKQNIFDSYSVATIKNTSSGSQSKPAIVTDRIQEVKCNTRPNGPPAKAETSTLSSARCQNMKAEKTAFDSYSTVTIQNVSSETQPKQITVTDDSGDGYAVVSPDDGASDTSEASLQSACSSEMDGSDNEATANDLDNAYAYADPMARDKWVLQHYALKSDCHTEGMNVSDTLEYAEVGIPTQGMISEYADADSIRSEISDDEDAPVVPSKDMLQSEKKVNVNRILKFKEKTEQKISALAQKAQLPFPKRNTPPKGPRENSKTRKQ